MWAPAVCTFLAMNWGAAGWLLIAGVAAVAAIHPSTRMAQRFLVQHVPAEDLADARASTPDPEESPAIRTR